MFDDPLQLRLKQMEDNHPSNEHHVGPLKARVDLAYFMNRYATGSVQEYTIEMRKEDERMMLREEREQFSLIRIGARNNWVPHSVYDARRYSH